MSDGVLVQSWESRSLAGLWLFRVLDLLHILSWDHRHPGQAREQLPKSKVGCALVLGDTTGQEYVQFSQVSLA